MNKCRILVLLVSCHTLAFVPGAMAQPAPNIPLIAKAPAFEAWTVTRVPASATTSSATATPTPILFPYQRQRIEIDVEKMDKTRHERWLWNTGQASEIWYVGKYSIAQQAQGADIYVLSTDSFSTSGPRVPDFSRSDFPELNWVSAGTYVGEAALNGHKCRYFETMATFAGHNRQLKAWIDKETSLPVGYDDGKGQALYSFHALQNPVTLPESFAKALKDYEGTQN